MGQPSEKQRKIYDTVKEAQQAALAIMRYGVEVADVHNVAAEVINATEFQGRFTHGLGQGRLYLRRGPVDLVRQQDIVEQRPGTKFELSLFMAVNIRTDEIGWQQVRGELDAVIITLNRLGQCLYRGCLCQPGHAFHQHMTVTHQADEHAVDKITLPDNPGGNMSTDAIKHRGIHTAIIGGATGI